MAVESFDYEEKNLSADDDSVVSMLHLGLMVDSAWMYAFGAAARSELRERLQPKVSAKAAVAPAGYQVTERSTAKAVAAATTYSNAKAGAAGMDGHDFQVAEAFEALI